MRTAVLVDFVLSAGLRVGVDVIKWHWFSGIVRLRTRAYYHVDRAECVRRNGVCTNL